MFPPDSSSSPVSSYSHLCRIAPWGSSNPTPQEYIRHRLEEEQRQLEILQQQLLQEQALLLVTGSLSVLGKMPS